MFKKSISPFACILIVITACIITFVGVASYTSSREAARINELRENWSVYTQYDTLKELAPNDTANYNKLASLISMYGEDTVREFDNESLWEDIFKAVPDGFDDRYGQYFTEEEYLEYIDNGRGDYVGIGIRVTLDDVTGGAYIYGVITDSPAQKAGLQKGDVITEANGVSGDYDALVNAVLGEPDTDVSLKITRGGEALEYTITRTAVKSENVLYEKLAGNVAHIQIITFNDVTVHTQFASKLEQAKADGCNKFIFDVRNNGGGNLEVICHVLDQLLPEGPIIHMIDNEGTTTTRNSDAKCLDAPMVVLCNVNTASAAELFTAALRDYELADIVGKTTYGKGSMQTTTRLSDGSAIKITTAFYNPPSNESYDGIGITPDYDIELDEKWKNNFYKMPKAEDTQLNKALELLNSAE